MDTNGILESISRFASGLATARAREPERGRLHASDFDSLRAAGFHRLALPAELGGLWQGVRGSVRPLCGALRALAAGDSSTALVAAMHPAVLSYWLTAPSTLDSAEWKAQLQAVFRSVIDGAFWGTITSEPGSGGDVKRTRATAQRGSSVLDFRLTGPKHFGSGSGVVSLMVTTAIPEGETDPDWFFVDLRGAPWDGSRGVTLIAAWEGHGMASTQSHAMRFDAFPATRFAWRGNLLEVSRRAGPFIGCLFTSVIAGIVDAAISAATESLGKRELTAFEQTEWTRARMEAWVAAQALEGMIRAVEEKDDPRLECLQGKTAVAELSETLLGRICRVLGGGTYSRRSPFGWWLEDARALGFLRPPWGLAFETMASL